MDFIFNPPEKLIQVETGVTSINVVDMYSRWKDWTMQSYNSKWSTPFIIVGGDPIDASKGIFITPYFFLTAGWKIRPQEASHKLVIEGGIISCLDGSDPIIPTEGNYNVLVQYSQPVLTETVVKGSAVTEQDKIDISNRVWDSSIGGHIISGTFGEKLINNSKEIIRRLVPFLLGGVSK